MLPEIPECDLLLIGGDLCPDYFYLHQRLGEYVPLPKKQGQWLQEEFTPWLEKVPAKHIVGVLGNHDFIGDHDPELVYGLPWTYLQDESAEVAGLKIHGTPYSTPFGRNWAYMKPDPQLAAHWDLIPEDVNILITHGPVYGYGDTVRYLYGYERDQQQGSHTLRNKLDYGTFPGLKLIVCGHIHEAYGTYGPCKGATVVNGSHVTLDYNPQNRPVIFELPVETK